MEENTDLALLSEILDSHPEASDGLGLFLTPALEPSGYDATPACCRPFAWTGGDGVHFSLADLSGSIAPVVMTVPMNFDAPNLVIGRDFRDFLALGLYSGYFGLEQLVYNRKAAIAGLAEFEHAGPDRECLEDIRKAFGVVPWSDVRARLDSLQTEYNDALT